MLPPRTRLVFPMSGAALLRARVCLSVAGSRCTMGIMLCGLLARATVRGSGNGDGSGQRAHNIQCALLAASRRAPYLIGSRCSSSFDGAATNRDAERCGSETGSEICRV